MVEDFLLSDGEPVFEVRTLGIYELDVIERHRIGPFTYPVEQLGGAIKHVEWDIGQYERLGREPPEPPATPEHKIEEDTEDWYQLRDYKRYQAALYHRKQQAEAAAQFYEGVVTYILDNCVPKEALRRVVTDDDWEKVYMTALVPQLTMVLIVETLRLTYQAEFEDQEILDALANVGGGGGSYNPVRVWENQWANQMGLSDMELATVPLRERARRVSAMMLTAWMETLEIERVRKKMATD